MLRNHRRGALFLGSTTSSDPRAGPTMTMAIRRATTTTATDDSILFIEHVYLRSRRVSFSILSSTHIYIFKADSIL